MSYSALVERFHRLSALDSAQAILSWDRSAMMPAGAAESRADTTATLAILAHEMLTAPPVADQLAAASADHTLSPVQQANLKAMQRAYIHATAVPAKLVDAVSRASSRCEQVWRQARPASDFAAVQPLLTELLALKREVAAAKAAALKVSLYDALLDEYEPDGRSAQIDPLFADLEQFLPSFLQEVLDHQGPEPAPLTGPFPIAKQETLARQVMATLGFDFDHGRLDTSAHPFCGGTAQDVRITTRYREDDFSGSLMGVIHETGHALYERGLPVTLPDHPPGQPAALARGMSVHESQSLLMEMQACRSPEFFAHVGPLIRQTFGLTASDEDLYRRGIRVRRSFIRVDADEVTYPLHVILRYRLEKDLIEGRMDVADLPAEWNRRFEALVGVPVPEHRLGCLQDIHWYDGAWGYFPTYTLGALTAAQLFAAAKAAVPEIPQAIADGNFVPLLGWLRTAIHQHASLKETPTLIADATGAPLSAAAFKAHLTRRYLGR